MPPVDALAPSVAVVGARGFIGRAVVAALRDRGVPTVCRGSQSPAVSGGRLDPEVAAAGTVVLVTGRSSPAQAEREPATAATELAESRELFDLLGRAGNGGVQRVLLASSGGAVYDTQQPAPFSEQSPVARASAYARLKLDLEEAFLAGAGSTSERTVLRLSNVYGPGQRLGTGQGVVGYWIRALLHEEPIQLFGDPETVRDYVYVTDVARAFVAASGAAGPLPEVVNIGSGEPTSLRQLAQVVLRAAARRHTWLDIGTAERVLAWRPTTDLQDGLTVTWEHARGNREQPDRLPD
jgi:UDP-glucose 4-epimerase